MRVEESVVVVSGAASGLGAATARRLHGRGARVVLFARAAEAGEALARGLGEGAAGDVADEASVKGAFDLARACFGAVRAVVGGARNGETLRLDGALRMAPK